MTTAERRPVGDRPRPTAASAGSGTTTSRITADTASTTGSAAIPGAGSNAEASPIGPIGDVSTDSGTARSVPAVAAAPGAARASRIAWRRLSQPRSAPSSAWEPAAIRPAAWPIRTTPATKAAAAKASSDMLW